MSTMETPPTFRCPPELTVTTADELKDALMALAGDEVIVDVTYVRRVDTAGLQVLVAAAVTWQRRSLRWRWTGRSNAIDEAAALAGVSAALGLTERT
jgi:anti-anti-sigma regulatory factor